MPISAFLPKSGHTFYYIRKQITIDIPRDSPTLHQPSIGTQVVTHFGISLLFRYPSIGTQIVTSLGISQHFRPQPKGTFFITSYHFAKRTIGTLLVTPLLYPKQKAAPGRDNSQPGAVFIFIV